MEATKGTMQGPKRMFKLKLIHRYFDDIAEDFPNDIAVICEGIKINFIILIYFKKFWSISL